MKTLVTGGAGYIGSHLVQRLTELDFEVYVVDDLSTGFADSIPKGVVLLKTDFSSQATFDLIKNAGIETIFHLAAKTNVSESIINPALYYQENFSKPLKLLTSAYDLNVKNFIFSSTAAVYGDPDGISEVSETSVCNPKSAYGKSKYFFEKALRDISDQYNRKFCALRYFNVAGAHSSGAIGPKTKNAENLIKVASEVACNKRKHIEIFGADYPTQDGTCLRDFIHIEDLVEAHIQAFRFLAKGGKSSVFNCGYGKAYSVLETIKTMQKVSKNEFKIITSPRRSGDIIKIQANSDKLKKECKWIPKYDNLELICKSAYEWEKKLNGEQGV